MKETHEISVKILEEAGYESAMIGLSYNKNQSVAHMPEVAEKLCTKDGGHNKFLEQIIIWLEVRAPRYWWQEADTYRLSSKSSQSTMHTILKDILVPENFECDDVEGVDLEYLNNLIKNKELVKLKRKLPEGFMQKRMWMMSYKTLRNIILQRKHHRLPHWADGYIDMVLAQVHHPELLPDLKEKASVTESQQALRAYLLSHEYDIAVRENDFYELAPVFKEIIGRDPSEEV